VPDVTRAIPVLDLAGDDPEERGRLHGEVFARSVAHNLITYLARFEASGLSPADALSEGSAWDKAIGQMAPAYAAEMRGIARGSGRSTAEIALLNARYEIAFTLFGRDARKADGPAAEPDGCTTAGLLPEACADGHTRLVQNWDWISAIRGHCLVMRVERRDAPSFISFTEAGIVGGKMGLNEHGIGLVENGLASDHDGRHPYEKPFHVRCREVLDGRTLHAAMMPIVQTRRTASANFVIGCATGEIVNLETSPDAIADLHPRDGIVTHSNHFLDPRHGPSQMERISPSTLFRAARLDRALRRNQGRLDMPQIQAALSDHSSFPHGLCRHSDPTMPPIRQTMTLASVVLDLDDRVLWIAEGTPCDNEFVAVPLGPETRVEAPHREGAVA
jgi:isopenicillin-N N-acyltransferase like protein